MTEQGSVAQFLLILGSAHLIIGRPGLVGVIITQLATRNTNRSSDFNKDIVENTFMIFGRWKIDNQISITINTLLKTFMLLSRSTINIS